MDGFSPLTVAVQRECSEVINVLLPNWRNTSADYALRLLSAQGDNCPPVIRLAADGNIIGVRKAVQAGEDVNENLKVMYIFFSFPLWVGFVNKKLTIS